MAEQKKKCPHLVQLGIFSCRAGELPYMPSVFELEEYCWKPMHARCPFYGGAARGRVARVTKT